MRVFDFNVKSRNALSDVTPRADNDNDMHCEVVTSPSMVWDSRIFRYPIRTKLPFRHVQRVLPEAMQYSGFMMDEECVVGLQVTVPP
jgi:hypothetical protein